MSIYVLNTFIPYEFNEQTSKSRYFQVFIFSYIYIRIGGQDDLNIFSI